jgi:hypothetical protein
MYRSVAVTSVSPLAGCALSRDVGAHGRRDLIDDGSVKGSCLVALPARPQGVGKPETRRQIPGVDRERAAIGFNGLGRFARRLVNLGQAQIGSALSARMEPQTHSMRTCHLRAPSSTVRWRSRKWMAHACYSGTCGGELVTSTSSMTSRCGRYHSQTYIEGYTVALLALGTAMPIGELPLYYCPGVGPDTSAKRIEQAIRRRQKTHAAAFKWAAREARDLPEDMHFNHPPALPDYSP